MPDNGLTVWGIGTPRAMRAHWIMAEFALPYDVRPVRSRSGETRTAEFLALNPKHKIPVLQHGDRVLTESAAIVAYVSEAFPAPEGFFVPRDVQDRAVLNEWCFFIMTELDALSLYVIRRHQDLFEIYGKAPDAIKAARENFTDLTDALFGGARPDTDYLMPQGFSIADILLSTCLSSAIARGIPLCDYLTAYRSRVTQRPAYRAAWTINYPDRPLG